MPIRRLQRHRLLSTRATTAGPRTPEPRRLRAAGQQVAKELLARTYDQLGYMAEASTWRNSYLTAAAELRNGPPKKASIARASSKCWRRHRSSASLKQWRPARTAPAAEDKNLEDQPRLSDTKDTSCYGSRTPFCTTRKPQPAPEANATLTLTKDFFIKMMAGTAGVKDLLLQRRAED